MVHKVSTANIVRSNLIAAVVNHEQILHETVIPYRRYCAHVEISCGKAAKQAVCDCGYRGSQWNHIIVSGKAFKQDTQY